MQKVSLVLRHYNKIKPINCNVISGDINKLFTIKFNENESSGAKMHKGDPVLIGALDKNNILNVNGGSVVSATPEDDKYIICSNDIVDIAKELEKRQYERYPVSLLGDIKLVDNNKRESTFIKDISYSGMCLYSTGDFNVDDVVEISIFFSNSVSRFDGTVVRKSVSFGRNEYGIQIIHRDKVAIDSTKVQLLSIIQSEKDLMYRHLLNANYKL